MMLHGYGGLEHLRWNEVQSPRAAAGEVVIHNFASGLNHCDIDLRRGLFGVAPALPHVMGVDCAGVVAELGEGVSDFRAGDRVMPHFMLACGRCRNCLQGRENVCVQAGILGVTVWGGYAQFTKVGAHHLVRVPELLPFEDAVAGAVPFATAWEALIAVGHLRAGETVLISAAGSGVGSAGIQIARLAGARVIATTGSAPKVAAAHALGAEVVLNYTEDDVPAAAHRLTGGLGVDLAFDMVGGACLTDAIAATALGGRVVSVGAHGGERVEIDMIELFRKHISLHGCGRSTRAIYGEILGLLAAQQLKPVIHARLPLSQAAEAHRLMEGRGIFGRIIMDPWQ